MLRKDRFLEIADAIENSPSLYDQGIYGDRQMKSENECMTPACIAGWAVFLYGDKGDICNSYIDEWAADLLGLDHSVAVDLFAEVWPLYVIDGSRPDDEILQKFFDDEWWNAEWQEEPDHHDAVRVLRLIGNS